MNTIPLYVESENGHDTINVPDKPEEIRKAVEDQLLDGKWVTTEKQDGSTEILTEKDIPKAEEPDEEIEADEEVEEEEEESKGDDDWRKSFTPSKSTPPTPKPTNKPVSNRDEWEDKFASVTSATATNKAKGG